MCATFEFRMTQETVLLTALGNNAPGPLVLRAHIVSNQSPGFRNVCNPMYVLLLTLSVVT